MTKAKKFIKSNAAAIITLLIVATLSIITLGLYTHFKK